MFSGPGTTFQVFDVRPGGTGIAVSVFDPDADRVDITRTPVNAARLVLGYSPGTPPGEYRVVLDPYYTLLGAGPAGPQVITPLVDDVGVVRVVPEPTVMGVVALGLTLAGRRFARLRSRR